MSSPVAADSPPRKKIVLTDRFGRLHTDLRVSVTDRCDLRCDYCMPAEGVPWLAKAGLLDDDELLRAVAVAVSLGVRSVRLTGGEPLLRRGLVGLVARLAALEPRPRLALTTNATGLSRLAGPLAEAGLDRVNVSLDTLRPERFAAITRRDKLGSVLQGLQAAHAAGLTPVKVNVVVVRGVNQDEVLDLAAWALGADYRLRFLEHMPLDAGHGWRRAEVVPAAEILDTLRTRYDLTPMPGRGAAPAEEFLVDGGPGRLGVVAPVTAPFCGACDRLRLTADGQVRSCLFARSEGDLRAVLRGGGTDADLAAVFLGEVAAKQAGHGIDDPGFLQPARPMSAIGG